MIGRWLYLMTSWPGQYIFLIEALVILFSGCRNMFSCRYRISCSMRLCFPIIFTFSGWRKLIENLYLLLLRKWRKVKSLSANHFFSSFLHFFFCLIELNWTFSTELMLLGFISLLLTATSSLISNICIPSKFYDSAFAPCTRGEVDEEREDNSSKERRLLMTLIDPHLHRRILSGLNKNTCPEASIHKLTSLVYNFCFIWFINAE